MQHRFSDDLDFFSKEELTNFRATINIILNATKKAGFQVETETVSDHFFRIFIVTTHTPCHCEEAFKIFKLTWPRCFLAKARGGGPSSP